MPHAQLRGVSHKTLSDDGIQTNRDLRVTQTPTDVTIVRWGVGLRRAGGQLSSFLGDSRLKWACKIALWKMASSSVGTLSGKQQGGRRSIRELYSAFITQIWSFMVIIICNRIIVPIYLLSAVWVGDPGMPCL